METLYYTKKPLYYTNRTTEIIDPDFFAWMPSSDKTFTEFLEELEKEHGGLKIASDRGDYNNDNVVLYNFDFFDDDDVDEDDTEWLEFRDKLYKQ